MTDALGNPIILNKSYGIAISTNGVSYIRLGNAINVTPKGNVTIDVKKSGIGNFKHEVEWKEEKPFKVSVRCYNLFPIND